MTDPVKHRHRDDAADRNTDRDMHVSEAERRSNDPTKQVYGAFDDPSEAIRTSDPTRTDGDTVFGVDDGGDMPDTVPQQPPPPGVGPFPRHLVFLVVALIIFVVLLAVLA